MSGADGGARLLDLPRARASRRLTGTVSAVPATTLSEVASKRLVADHGVPVPAVAIATELLAAAPALVEVER